MGVGHLAAGLMLKKVEPQINLGFLFFVALHCFNAGNYSGGNRIVLVSEECGAKRFSRKVLRVTFLFWVDTHFTGKL
jgi:hypothetical protein